MIGIFDSGVGGLSILQAVRQELLQVDLVYFADTKNFPYGTKSASEIQMVALEAATLLAQQQPAAIVVACNTASTVGLPIIRQSYPNIPIIGVVPAIKPAVSLSRAGVIAVLGTAATVQSETYQELKKQFAAAVIVIDQACPGWVEMVERGDVTGDIVEKEVAAVVEPLLAKNVDVLVLACTHYPFLRPVIEKIANGRAVVIDSGQAVAEQVQWVLESAATSTAETGQETFLCSGDIKEFSQVASKLLGREISGVEV